MTTTTTKAKAWTPPKKLTFNLTREIIDNSKQSASDSCAIACAIKAMDSNYQPEVYNDQIRIAMPTGTAIYKSGWRIRRFIEKFDKADNQSTVRA